MSRTTALTLHLERRLLRRLPVVLLAVSTSGRQAQRLAY